jgi:pilus assembly protein TadC
MDITLLSFVAVCAAAGAAAAVAAVNLGVTRVRHASPLDQPPAVAGWAGALAIALGVGLPAGWVLAALVSPALGLLGAGIGLALAFAWRALRLRRWTNEITRDFQALLAMLLIQLDSGGDSLYRALEIAVSESSLAQLRPIVERHVLARKAAGVPLEQALGDLARCRLLRDAPLVQDALARLADLVARDVPAAHLVEALRLMDSLMTDIARIEREQAAQAAQMRYSTYAVALLTAGMAATLFFVARDLGDLLLHTLPGNLTLIGVCGAIATAIIIAEKSTETRPLRF